MFPGNRESLKTQAFRSITMNMGNMIMNITIIIRSTSMTMTMNILTGITLLIMKMNIMNMIIPMKEGSRSAGISFPKTTLWPKGTGDISKEGTFSA
jgi:hypothetical protein